MNKWLYCRFACSLFRANEGIYHYYELVGYVENLILLFILAHPLTCKWHHYMSFLMIFFCHSLFSFKASPSLPPPLSLFLLLLFIFSPASSLYLFLSPSLSSSLSLSLFRRVAPSFTHFSSKYLLLEGKNVHFQSISPCPLDFPFGLCAVFCSLSLFRLISPESNHSGRIVLDYFVKMSHKHYLADLNVSI